MKTEVEIISGRTLDQGETVEEKLTEDYFKAVSYCELSEEDFGTLELSDGDRVKVKTEFGEVVVFAVKNKDLPKGLVFIPMGPYANMVIDPNTDGTGMPQFKGIKGSVEKTDEKVKSVKELIEVI
jgi:formylmethanofuran dehydrogenase subunit D